MPEPDATSPLISTLLVADLVNSTALLEELGDERAAAVFARHDRVARDLMVAYHAEEIDKTDGFLLNFDRPVNAVRYAIAYHRELRVLGEELGILLEARIGIHLGEVIRRVNTPEDIARGAKPVELDGLAKPMVARVMSLATARQTLLTSAAFDLARRGTARVEKGDQDLIWLAHGAYVLKGVSEAVEVYEVGETGVAPLTPPGDTEKVQRVIDPDTIVGWRPAPGIEIPLRPNWVLQEKVGVGGFGDVWLAEHKKTHETRVFKFCYDARRLHGLKREVTLVRLLKEELGDRRDISRILDWNFDEVPYFLEAEYTSAGNLEEWVAQQGGAEAIPLALRVEFVAQIADALAAAHSVGVLHKDIKPSNILITVDPDGSPRTQLADFGIGLLTDRGRLDQAGITSVGFTEVEEMTDLSATGIGTRLYMAPELLEGRPSTVHADVYALGVVFYQLVIGNFSRALGPGWERLVTDPLLQEDIASAVEGQSDRRVDIRKLAESLRTLDARREARRLAEEEEARAVLAHRRRRWVGLATAGLALVAVATGVQLRRVALEGQRANREAETARRVSEFMIGLFRLADPSEARGNSVTAREILDEGASRIEAELADQPEVQATLMTNMGKVYLGLGLPSGAEPMIERALAIRRERFGADALETAEALQVLGEVRTIAGKNAAAEAALTEALTIRANFLGPNDPAVAEVLRSLSAARRGQANYDGALEAGERSVAIYRSLEGYDGPKATALSETANVLFSINRFTEAEALFREALAVVQKLYGEDHRLTSQMMNNLGLTLTAQARYAEAEQLAARALAINRKLHGNDHWEVGASAAALAILLHQQRKFAPAELLFRESLTIFKKHFGSEHGFTLGTEANLAWVTADQGRCTDAEPMIRATLDRMTAVLPAEHWSLAHAQSILGGCLAGRRQYAEAEPLLTASYESLARIPGGLWAKAALDRVIDLYRRMGQPTKVAEYTAKRKAPK